MLPNLIVVILLPIIMATVSISPFQPPEAEDEQIPEIPVDESQNQLGTSYYHSFSNSIVIFHR